MVKKIRFFLELLSKKNYHIRVNNKKYKGCIALSKDSDSSYIIYNFHNINTSEDFDYKDRYD